MIKKLILENWKSHEHSIFEFSKGTNILLGVMGSGKSSVLDAISFALFGTFPSIEKRRMTIEKVIRYDLPKARVVMEFSWKGKEYKIERIIERKKRLARIYEDGSLVEEGTSATTKFVENLLETDYQLFSRAIYSEQNKIDYFLTLEPRKRKAEFDELLGLDRFERARDNAVRLTNKLKRLEKELSLSLDVEEYKRNLENLKKKKEELVSLKKDYESLKPKLDELRKKGVALKKELEELKTKKAKFEEISRRLSFLSGSIKKLEESLKKKEKKDIPTLEKEALDINKEIKEKRELIAQRQKERNRLEKELSLLREKLTEQDRLLELERKYTEELEKLSDVSEKVSFQEKEIKEIEDKIAVYRHRILDIERIISEIKSENGKCPLCGGPLTPEHAEEIKAERRKELIRLRESLKGLESNLAKMKETLSKLKEMERRAISLKARIRELTSKKIPVDELSSKINRLNSKLPLLVWEKEEKELEEKIRERERILNELKEQKEFEKREKELAELKATKESLVSEQKSMRVDESEIKKLESRFEEISSEYSELKGKAAFFEGEIKSREEFILLLSKEIEKHKRIAERVERLRKKIDEITTFKNALEILQIQFREELIDAINRAMNEIWSVFYPYGDYTSIRVRAEEKDYSFEIYDGEWKKLEGIASGGERACFALTLRVALATVLAPSLSMLILDEPTHNLDREAVQLLSRTLQYEVPKLIEQTFVITHDEMLSGSEFASSYKLIREKKGRDKTMVERLGV